MNCYFMILRIIFRPKNLIVVYALSDTICARKIIYPVCRTRKMPRCPRVCRGFRSVHDLQSRAMILLLFLVITFRIITWRALRIYDRNPFSPISSPYYNLTSDNADSTQHDSCQILTNKCSPEII